MPYTKDLVTKKTDPALLVICHQTFWRKRWRWHLQHSDGRILAVSGDTFDTVKELLANISTVRGKNNWPVHVSDKVGELRLADETAEMEAKPESVDATPTVTKIPTLKKSPKK
jgi:hypothetical protein